MSQLSTTTRSTIVSDSRDEALRGMRAALPMMIGIFPFAVVLGTQAMQTGFSVPELSLLSGLNFAGGSEFAALKVWTSPPHVFLIMAITFLINCRHILMGVTLTPYLRHLPKRQVLPALFLMCDESWALTLADIRQRQASQISFAYYLGASIALYSAWVVFTTIGAMLGTEIGNVDQYGFDMAFIAVFLVLLKGMWKGGKNSLPWGVSLLVAAITYKVIPGAWYVAAGAVSGLIAAVVWSGHHVK